MTQGHFPLPHTIATSPPSSADSGPTFPRLKVKFTPRVTLPTNVAPQKPKPKALEETIKVVASLGRKIAISWSVNAASLLETGILPEGAQEAFEDSIGSWVLKNRDPLGIEDATWATDDDGVESATSLLLTPVSASPSHSPLTTHLIPSSEPTAALVRVELALWWQAQGKRKADELDGEDNNDDPASDKDTSELRRPARVSQDGSARQSSVKSVALEQIDALMPEILRRMIRRFPFVFDGSFLDYRQHLVLPPSLLTALSTFAFASARHRPDFHVKCSRVIGKLEESRRQKVEGQIKAVALLPARKKPGRRKVEPQCESQSQEDSQAAREQAEEAASYTRATVAIKAASRADADLLARQRLHRLVAERVSAAGTTKWLDIRRKGGRMGSSRAAVVAPDVDYAQGPPVEAIEGETVPRELPLAAPLGGPSLRHNLLSYHQSKLPLPIWDDDYDDLDYEDDDFAGLEDGMDYGRNDGYDDISTAYGNRYGQDDRYATCRDGRAPHDPYEDDLEDGYDEEIGAPMHSPLLLHGNPRGAGAAGSSPLAHFSSLQLADVPTYPPSSHTIPHLDHSEDDLEEDLDTPLADHLVDDHDGLLPEDFGDYPLRELGENLVEVRGSKWRDKSGYHPGLSRVDDFNENDHLCADRAVDQGFEHKCYALSPVGVTAHPGVSFTSSIARQGNNEGLEDEPVGGSDHPAAAVSPTALDYAPLRPDFDDDLDDDIGSVPNGFDSLDRLDGPHANMSFSVASVIPVTEDDLDFLLDQHEQHEHSMDMGGCTPTGQPVSGTQPIIISQPLPLGQSMSLEAQGAPEIRPQGLNAPDDDLELDNWDDDLDLDGWEDEVEHVFPFQGMHAFNDDLEEQHGRHDECSGDVSQLCDECSGDVSQLRDERTGQQFPPHRLHHDEYQHRCDEHGYQHEQGDKEDQRAQGEYAHRDDEHASQQDRSTYKDRYPHVAKHQPSEMVHDDFGDELDDQLERIPWVPRQSVIWTYCEPVDGDDLDDLDDLGG